jgi:hypothetical protein
MKTKPISTSHYRFVLIFSALFIIAAFSLNGKINPQASPDPASVFPSEEHIFKQQFPSHLSFYDTLMANGTCSETSTLKAGETGSVTCGEFVKAVKNFGAAYTSAGNLDYYPVKLPFNSATNADLIDIFSNMNDQDRFGLVFHYGYENKGGKGKLLYLLSKGTLESDSVQYCPFSDGENDQTSEHFIYLDPGSAQGFQVIDETTFDNFKKTYTDSMRIETDGVVKPVSQIVHPSMVYHNPQSFWDFYETYKNNPNLHLYIAPGGIRPEGLSTPMHAPFFVFGNDSVFFELNNTDRGRDNYREKALDIGQLCPPCCGAVIRCP